MCSDIIKQKKLKCILRQQFEKLSQNSKGRNSFIGLVSEQMALIAQTYAIRLVTSARLWGLCVSQPQLLVDGMIPAARRLHPGSSLGEEELRGLCLLIAKPRLRRRFLGLHHDHGGLLPRTSVNQAMADRLAYRNMTGEEWDEDNGEAYGEQRHASSLEMLTIVHSSRTGAPR